VGVRDVLSVQVWGHDDLARRLTVSEKGTLFFPLIGEVRVAGLTCDQVSARLTSLLADGYVREPQVHVEVADYQSQRVFIYGEVVNPQRAPGTYVLKGRTTLLELIAYYGGTTNQADQAVTIVRKTGVRDEKPAGADEEAASEGGEPGTDMESLPIEARQKMLMVAEGTKLIKVKLADLLSGDPKYNPALVDRDIVLIPRRSDQIRRVFIVGDAERTGPMPLSEGMTLAKLITIVGVPVSENVTVSVYASGQKGTDARRFTTSEVILGRKAQALELKDGDFIYFKRDRGTFYVVGEVRQPGAFFHRDKLTVREAIVMAGWTTPEASLSRVKVLRLVGGKWETSPVELNDTVREGDIITVPERWL
jgi:protein involved in polysaccharide export with SLBB domain